MNQENEQCRNDEMREEYDFKGGVRGKYAKRIAQESNIVVLDSDVARFFPDSASVNAALRELARIAERCSGNIER